MVLRCGSFEKCVVKCWNYRFEYIRFNLPAHIIVFHSAFAKSHLLTESAGSYMYARMFLSSCVVQNSDELVSLRPQPANMALFVGEGYVSDCFLGKHATCTWSFSSTFSQSLSRAMSFLAFVTLKPLCLLRRKKMAVKPLLYAHLLKREYYIPFFRQILMEIRKNPNLSILVWFSIQ